MNVKHPNSQLRNMAKEAKQRLAKNAYNLDEIRAPKDITPQQKQIYLKLLTLKRGGETNINPVEQFADKQLLSNLPYSEKQRYIMQVCADYIAVKSYVEKAM